MNKVNLKATLDLIKQYPIHMRMYELLLRTNAGKLRDQGPMCGTIACIAGYAYIASGGELIGDEPPPDTLAKARKFLGLTGDEAYCLFFGHWIPEKSLSKVTAKDVINHLQSLLKD